MTVAAVLSRVFHIWNWLVCCDTDCCSYLCSTQDSL